MYSSKKGISSNQLHRTFGVTLKTAWFMSHRLREAMRVLQMEPVGGAGKPFFDLPIFTENNLPQLASSITSGAASKPANARSVQKG
jgi:hypothetical protein